MKERIPVTKNAGFLVVLKTVLWSFFGVRKRSDHDADAVSIKPVQIVVAGIVGGALFVFILIVVVRIIIASHAATT